LIKKGTNGILKGLNFKIQLAKKRAKGYRAVLVIIIYSHIKLKKQIKINIQK